ncbi:MAG: hypothetical protein KDB14_10225 [Planctomycetales bacterium]|nr:hypothetical protein [Planctomycetales bacterium]
MTSHPTARPNSPVLPWLLRQVTLSIASLSWLATNAALAAPPSWTQSLPTGVQQGQETKLTLLGSFSHWPPQVHVDEAGLTVTPGDKSTLIVKAAADARLGVHWVRLFDEEGATALRPIIVGAVAEQQEQEPNDDVADTKLLELPRAISGKLEKSGDVDGFRVAVKSGQQLVAAALGNRWLDSPMDAVLQVCDTNGFVLAQNDDQRGIDPLVTWRADADREVIVRLFAFPSQPNSTIRYAGGGNYIYRLELTTGPFVDASLPLSLPAEGSAELSLIGWNLPETAAVAAGDDRHFHVTAAVAGAAGFAIADRLGPPAVVCRSSEPLEISAPCVVSGHLAAVGERHTLKFKAEAKQRFRILVDAVALGFPLDPAIAIVDGTGKVVAETDDISRNNQDAALDFAAPAAGDYELRVWDTHGRGGDRMLYRLTITEPLFQLTAPADQYVIEPGKPLELKVTVARDRGFDMPIQVEATGLPEGVAAEAVTSETKGDSAKAVTLKLVSTTTTVIQAPFQIVGVAGEARMPALFAVANSPQRIRQFWLTAKANKPAEPADKDAKAEGKSDDAKDK